MRTVTYLPWATFALRVVANQPAPKPAPREGFRYLMNLDELAFRNWRRAVDVRR